MDSVVFIVHPHLMFKGLEHFQGDAYLVTDENEYIRSMEYNEVYSYKSGNNMFTQISKGIIKSHKIKPVYAEGKERMEFVTEVFDEMEKALV